MGGDTLNMTLRCAKTWNISEKSSRAAIEILIASNMLVLSSCCYLVAILCHLTYLTSDTNGVQNLLLLAKNDNNYRNVVATV